MNKELIAMQKIPGMAFGRIDIFSADEMARRRRAASDAMEKAGADALIMFRSANYTNPYILWLTGFRQTCIPDVFVLKDGDIYHIPGPKGLDPTHSPYLQGDGDLWRILRGCRCIGFAGLGLLDYEMKCRLEAMQPAPVLIDLTQALDLCRAVKSTEEIAATLEAVRIHDKVYRCLPDFVYPGRRERDIASDILTLMEREGADFSDYDGIIPQTVYIEMHKGSGPNTVGGSISQSVPIKWPGQLIEEDDWFQLCMHGHGPGGYVAQKSRNVFLTQPSDMAYEYWSDCIKAQDFVASLIKPGADLKEVKKEVNQWLQDCLGCEPNAAGFVRGMGVMWSEQPNMDREDCPKICENMVFMMQPRIVKNGYTDMCQETFIVGKDGSWTPSQYPRELIVLR